MDRFKIRNLYLTAEKRRALGSTPLWRVNPDGSPGRSAYGDDCGPPPLVTDVDGDYDDDGCMPPLKSVCTIPSDLGDYCLPSSIEDQKKDKKDKKDGEDDGDERDERDRECGVTHVGVSGVIHDLDLVGLFWDSFEDGSDIEEQTEFTDREKAAFRALRGS